MTRLARLVVTILPIAGVLLVVVGLLISGAAKVVPAPPLPPRGGRVIGYVQMEIEVPPCLGNGSSSCSQYAVSLGRGLWRIYLLDGSTIGRLHMGVQEPGRPMGPLTPVIVGPDD